MVHLCPRASTPLFALAACLATEIGAAQGAPLCALELDTLVADDGAPDDVFSWSVAIDGDTLAVGAFRDDDAGQDSGSVYVYRGVGSAWVLEQKLVAPDGMAFDGFAQALALQGETLVIGAYKDDDRGNNSGSAYVYVRAGTQWTQQAKLFGGDTDEKDWFGYAVDIDGERVVVGAPFRTHPDDGGGTAYVFVRNGTSWSEEAVLAPAAGSAGDAMGWDVAIDGTHAVLTAPTDDVSGPGAGSAYVFTRSGSSWSEQQRLVSSDSAAGDQFGFSLDSNAGRIGIGARFGGPANAGSAYVFEETGGVWSEVVRLEASDGAANDAFGWDLVIAGATLAVGAPFDQDAGIDTGAVYLFGETQPGVWTERPKILASNATQRDSFGFRLALRARSLIVSAPAWKPNSNVNGTAYHLELLDSPSTYCTAKTNSCGTLPAMGSSGLPSASASAGFEVFAANTRALKAGLLLYGDAGPASAPFQGGLLCVNPAPLKRSTAVADVGGSPGQCDGELRIDLNAFAAGGLGGNPLPSLSLPGTEIHCQFWGRDTVANGSLLSDGLRYDVCP